MLTHLSIENIVLIDRADIEFARGLNVLTGETGAGKSILLDALSLVLGARSDAGLLRAGAEKASVTAEFELDDSARLKAMLEPLGIEVTKEMVLRRVINQAARTRAFINDTPVSVQALKAAGELLVEIHGQHESRELMDVSAHLDWLDEFAGTKAPRAALASLHAAWRTAENALAAHLAGVEEARREEEFLRHSYRELELLSPKEGEMDELLDTRKRMQEGEKHRHALQAALTHLNQPRGVDAALKSATRALPAEVSSLEKISELLDRAASDAEEAIALLEDMASEGGLDAHRLSQLEDRLFALKDIARKHRISNEELPAFFAELKAKLDSLSPESDAMVELKKAASDTRSAYMKAAQGLSDARTKASGKLEAAVKKELVPLKMAGTELKVSLSKLDEKDWAARGMERVQFLVATNQGAGFGPLNKIASGGELSRFMLALKAALKNGSGGTMIFDEIDAGTSGAVADAIGERLAGVSKEAQVIVITHLPQVAAKGSHHIRVWKETVKGQSFTRARELSKEERGEELARMLSGAEVTKEARAAAKKLMAG